MNYPTILNKSGSLGTITIEGGKIYSEHTTTISNYSIINILGGEIYSKNEGANCLENDGTATITGNALLESNNVSYSTVRNSEFATLIMNSGTVRNNSGGYAIYNLGTATVTGGTRIPKNYGI